MVRDLYLIIFGFFSTSLAGFILSALYYLNGEIYLMLAGEVHC